MKTSKLPLMVPPRLRPHATRNPHVYLYYATRTYTCTMQPARIPVLCNPHVYLYSVCNPHVCVLCICTMQPARICNPHVDSEIEPPRNRVSWSILLRNPTELQISMSLLNSLPFEIQDYIYAFDGRYKKAMDNTIRLIKGWGMTQTAIRLRRTHPARACIKLNGTIPDKHYNEELLRRVKRHQQYLTPEGCIDPRKYVKNATWYSPKRVNGMVSDNGMVFKDVLGTYKVTKEHRMTIVDGEEYFSAKKHFVVSICDRYGQMLSAGNVTTKVSKYYLFDPELIKKIKRRKDPTKVFLEHGLSPNGTRVPKVCRRKAKTPVPEPVQDLHVDIDGNDYIVRNGMVLDISTEHVVGIVWDGGCRWMRDDM